MGKNSQPNHVGLKEDVLKDRRVAPQSLCPCWRLLRSYATVFSRWLHSAIFLKGETQPLSEALQFSSDWGKAEVTSALECAA